MTSRMLILAVCGSLSLFGCKKQEPQPDQADPTAAAAEPLTDEAVDQAPIQVKEDFEEQAEKAISEDNLESSLDALEAEITADQE